MTKKTRTPKKRERKKERLRLKAIKVRERIKRHLQH